MGGESVMTDERRLAALMRVERILTEINREPRTLVQRGGVGSRAADSLHSSALDQRFDQRQRAAVTTEKREERRSGWPQIRKTVRKQRPRSRDGWLTAH